MVSAKPFLQGHGRAESEELARTRVVHPSPRLSVRLRPVPDELSLEADEFDDQLGEVLDRDLFVRAEVHGIGTVVVLGCQEYPFGCIVDVEELARCRARPPHLDDIVAGLLGLDSLLDQRRDHVRHGWIELVARAVHVRGQQVDDVLSVLLPVRLRVNEHRFLGNAVRSIRLFGEAGPEVVLFERDLGELRVRADRSQQDRLGHLSLPSLLEEERPHEQVRHVEVRGMLHVGADPADACRQMDHEIGIGVLEQTGDVFRLREVVVTATGDGDIGRSALAKLAA